MKRFWLCIVAVLALMLPAIGYGGGTNFDSVITTPSADDDYGFRMNNSSGTRLFSVTKDTGAIYSPGTSTLTTATITTLNHSRERSIPLPLMGFVSNTDAAPLSTTTTPGLEIDDLLPAIVWADGEATPVLTTFRIPVDYASGGAFRLFCTESDSTTPNQVDFDVYVNSNGVAADAAATGQTPVALAGTTATTSVVTLTPATDFAALAAGYWVTLRIWRDDTAEGTGDLEVKGVDFYYTAAY
ncbi:MAG: hypothetical protein WC455_17370 [Dehalococcoidia bacterium]|jgi:hypothetical protein